MVGVALGLSGVVVNPVRGKGEFGGGSGPGPVGGCRKPSQG